jgi:hypothetical protein
VYYTNTNAPEHAMRTAERAPLTLVTSLLGAEGVDTGTATEAGAKALSTLTPSHGAQRGRLAQRPSHAKLHSVMALQALSLADEPDPEAFDWLA